MSSTTVHPGCVCVGPATQGAQTNSPGSDWLKTNFGGEEKIVKVAGNNNQVTFHGKRSDDEESTLLRKASAQVGRILEGGTDIVVSPAKWLNHMQENWPIYLVCITIIVVSILIIYCCIRRKSTSFDGSSYSKLHLSKVIMDEARKMASSHHTALEL